MIKVRAPLRPTEPKPVVVEVTILSVKVNLLNPFGRNNGEKSAIF